MHEFRPMSVSEILDTTFRLYRERFVTFLTIALIVYVPFALLMAVVLTPLAMSTATNSGPSPVALLVSGLAMLILALVMMPLCSAALTHNISAAYLGQNLSAAESYQRALPRLGGLIGSQILAGIIVMLGLLLLVVGAVIFGLWFYVLAPVVILEGVSGTAALGRSRELMRGNLGKGFLVAFLTGLLVWLIGQALTRGLALVPWPHPVLAVFFMQVAQALLLPIQTAPIVLLYYDLRIRKEAFDLQMLSSAIEQPPLL